MIIKNITRTKYGYNLWIDDFKLNIEEEVFFKHPIKKESIITKPFLNMLIKENEVAFIKRKSLVYLARKRSVLQFKTYLRSLNASEAQINELTNSYKKKNYLNDLEYAKSLIEQYENRYGRKKLEKVLFEKGIHKDLSSELLKDHQDLNLEEQIKKASKTVKAINYKRGKDKLVRTFVSKGYQIGEINYYIDLYLKEEQFNEYEIIKKDYQKLLNKYQDKLKGKDLYFKIKSLLYQRGYKLEVIEQLLRGE